MQTPSSNDVFPRALGPMMKFAPGANSVSYCSKQRKCRSLIRETTGDAGGSALIACEIGKPGNSLPGGSQGDGPPGKRQLAGGGAKLAACRQDMQTLPGF